VSRARRFAYGFGEHRALRGDPLRGRGHGGPVTNKPRPSAAMAITATPIPDAVRESSSMARVEKTTVTEP
jgi:hypothetical protein